MEIKQELKFFQFKNEAEGILDESLIRDESNYLALYGKSLILFNEGKFEASAEFLKKALDVANYENKANELREKVADMLEPKPPSRVVIMDELAKRHEDFVKHSFLLNFMTLPRPPPAHIASTVSTTPVSTFPHQENRIPAQAPHRNTEKPRKDFSCVFCGKSFARVFSLTRHILLHNGTKSHACRLYWRLLLTIRC